MDLRDLLERLLAFVPGSERRGVPPPAEHAPERAADRELSELVAELSEIDEEAASIVEEAEQRRRKALASARDEAARMRERGAREAEREGKRILSEGHRDAERRAEREAARRKELVEEVEARVSALGEGPVEAMVRCVLDEEDGRE